MIVHPAAVSFHPLLLCHFCGQDIERLNLVLHRRPVAAGVQQAPMAGSGSGDTMLPTGRALELASLQAAATQQRIADAELEAQPSWMLTSPHGGGELTHAGDIDVVALARRVDVLAASLHLTITQLAASTPASAASTPPSTGASLSTDEPMHFASPVAAATATATATATDMCWEVRWDDSSNVWWVALPSHQQLRLSAAYLARHTAEIVLDESTSCRAELCGFGVRRRLHYESMRGRLRCRLGKQWLPPLPRPPAAAVRGGGGGGGSSAARQNLDGAAALGASGTAFSMLELALRSQAAAQQAAVERAQAQAVAMSDGLERRVEGLVAKAMKAERERDEERDYYRRQAAAEAAALRVEAHEAAASQEQTQRRAQQPSGEG